jgi:hypothetical protein
LMGAETVKTHLAHVYEKLGVHTRAALATAVRSAIGPQQQQPGPPDRTRPAP